MQKSTSLYSKLKIATNIPESPTFVIGGTVIKGLGQQTLGRRGDYVLAALEFDSLWLFSTPQATLDTVTSKPSTDNSLELGKERKKENNKARSCASAAPVLNIIVLKYSVHAPLCHNH